MTANTNLFLPRETVSSILDIVFSTAPEGFDFTGWSEARMDLPDGYGIETAYDYWADRLTTEAAEWLNADSFFRINQEAFRQRPVAYYEARSAHLTAVAEALTAASLLLNAES